MHLVKENNGYSIYKHYEKLAKVKAEDDELETRFIFNDEIYHFRVAFDGVNTMLTSFKGSFFIDKVVPIEEYKIIYNKKGRSYEKRIYSSDAIKKYEIESRTDTFKTSVSYDKDPYLYENKSFIKLGKNIYSSVGLYELKYGKKNNKVFDYIARIDKDTLNFWEINDDEFIKESEIGDVLNRSEIERCIKAFISSNPSARIFNEVKGAIPKSLLPYFKKEIETIESLVLDKQEEVRYIDEFFKNFKENDVLSSELEKHEKEDVVRLVRCEF